MAFYGRLNQIYAQAWRIYVIQDNWSIHQHPDVVAALAEFPGWNPYGCPPMRLG